MDPPTQEETEKKLQNLHGLQVEGQDYRPHLAKCLPMKLRKWPWVRLTSNFQNVIKTVPLFPLLKTLTVESAKRPSPKLGQFNGKTAVSITSVDFRQRLYQVLLLKLKPQISVRIGDSVLFNNMVHQLNGRAAGCKKFLLPFHTGYEYRYF